VHGVARTADLAFEDESRHNFLFRHQKFIAPSCYVPHGNFVIEFRLEQTIYKFFCFFSGHLVLWSFVMSETALPQRPYRGHLQFGYSHSKNGCLLGPSSGSPRCLRS
jgi:hypothetical protein